MVDLISQYNAIKVAVDFSILDVLSTAQFIKGPKVKKFEDELGNYLKVKEVITCANGTDALQIALMALELKPGDEIIVPSFTYAATAEVIALLNLKPVMVDVDPMTFNLTSKLIESAITPNTKAIIPVHLYGQSSDMEAIMKLAEAYNLYVIEDNAQAIGADYTFSNGEVHKTGTIGHIGCTSFFPSKNLGCYGDGGAIFTNDDALGKKIRMIANHGQEKKYHHAVIGVNSRLDAIQAAILSIKLSKLDIYTKARQQVAEFYDAAFSGISAIQIPSGQRNSTHVFHQYTIQIKNGQRDALKVYLKTKGIPSMIYYPIPLYQQEAFKSYYLKGRPLVTTENLCKTVLSLPIHTEMTNDVLSYIVSAIQSFFELG